MIDRDTIIRMAREAGFTREDHHAIDNMLVRFAKLVAAAEREACIEIVESIGKHGITVTTANVIRARGINDKA